MGLTLGNGRDPSGRLNSGAVAVGRGFPGSFARGANRWAEVFGETSGEAGVAVAADPTPPGFLLRFPFRPVPRYGFRRRASDLSAGMGLVAGGSRSPQFWRRKHVRSALACTGFGRGLHREIVVKNNSS